MATELTKLKPWRFYFDWSATLSIFLASTFLSERFGFAFYPVTIFFNGHAFFRLLNLGHEGVHHLLSPRSRLNDFLSRYLCLFPAFASLTRFRTLHLFHHRFLGQVADPDQFQYRMYPMPVRRWLRRCLAERFQLRAIRDYAMYFTEIPDRLRLSKTFSIVENQNSDFLAFVLFWSVAIAGSLSVGVLDKVLLYWVVPAALWLPWIRMVTALQHGAFPDGVLSRSIQSDGPLQTTMLGLIFPLHVNHHGEHHANPRIPHYNLAAFGQRLDKTASAMSGVVRISFYKNIRALFQDSRCVSSHHRPETKALS